MPFKKPTETRHCQYCDTDVSKRNWAKHLKSKGHARKERDSITCKDVSAEELAGTTLGAEIDPIGGGATQGSETGRGQLFFLTFQQPVKYQLLYKIHRNSRHDNVRLQITAFAIGNEWGALADYPNGHCHAVIKTQDKYTYTELRGLLELYKYPIPGDMERVKNLRQSLRYVTKEDFKAMVSGFDQDLCSTIYKAYHYARVVTKIDWTRYPASNIAAGDRKLFEQQFRRFAKDNQNDALVARLTGQTLLPWQDRIRTRLLNQTDRQVTWVYDPVGNTGKTYLGQWLCAFDHGIMFENGKKADIAMAFEDEPIVIFNFTRDKEGFVNYSVMESFKDGVLWSPKYESQVKRFLPCKVLCLANWKPDETKLSMDRWDRISIINNVDNNGMNNYDIVEFFID